MDPSQPQTRAVPLVVPPTGVDPHPAVYPTAPDPHAVTYADLPAAPPVYRTTEGTSQKRRRKTPLAWLPWALLGAILALVLLAWLVSALVDGGGDKTSTATPATSTATGTLTARGADLTAQPTALRNHIGQAAVGRGVAVQSVVSDEGFWVGSSASDRVYVHLTPQARGGQGESPFQVRAGQHIDLNGTVTAFRGQAFGVTEAEGLAQLRDEAAYVEATTVRLSS